MTAVGGIGSADINHMGTVGAVFSAAQCLSAVGAFEKPGKDIQIVLQRFLVFSALNGNQLVCSFPSLS